MDGAIMRPPDETGQPNPGREPEDQAPFAGAGDRHPTEPMEPYLRLHAHIEALRADRRPPHPGPLSAEEGDVYRMAALFRSATPDAAEPDPAFAARLRAQLAREQAPSSAGARAASARPTRGAGGLSRRGIIGGGLGAAAAMVAGAVIGSQISREMLPSAAPTSIVTDGQGQWIAVADVAAIPIGAVKWFATTTIVGFVRNVGGEFHALSGVCTHMGCLLQWNGTDRTFDCPCHGGRFSEDGHSAPASPVSYSPLPTLETKVEQNKVWVYVASSIAPQPQQTVPGGPYGANGDGN
jgi:Rieske Fe-S protein